MKFAKIFKILMSCSFFFGLLVIPYGFAKLKKSGIKEWDRWYISNRQLCLANPIIIKENATLKNGNLCIDLFEPKNIEITGASITYNHSDNKSIGVKENKFNINLKSSKAEVRSNLGFLVEIDDLSGSSKKFTSGPIRISFGEAIATGLKATFEAGVISIDQYAVLYKDISINGSQISCLINNKICTIKDSQLHKNDKPIAKFEKLELSKQISGVSFKSGQINFGHEKLSSILPIVDRLSGHIGESEESYNLSIGDSVTIKSNKQLTKFDVNIEGECQSVLDDIKGIWEAPFKMNGAISIHGTYNGLLNVEGSYSCIATNPPVEFQRKTLRSRFTRIAYEADLKQFEETSGPNTDLWVHLDEIPEECASAFVYSEDGRFYSHKGIDLKAFTAAMNENIKAGKWKRGGSTISMQTAKNLWLNRDRTLSRKIAEMFYTMHLESILSKKEILETYINIAEMGPGSYGIRFAADYHYDEPVSSLTPHQCALLTSLLPNPKLSLLTDEGVPSERRQKHADSIIKRMKN